MSRAKYSIPLTGALAVALVFRFQLANGFSLLFGDSYDGFIEVSILEHWNNVVHGASSWHRTLSLYPEQNGLSFNDGYFLFGLIYSAFRAVGADPLLGGELVNIAVRAVGFFGFYAASRRILDIRTEWALAGGAVFTLCNGAYVSMDHAQFLTVCFVPLNAMLLFRAGRALMQDDRQALLKFGAAFMVFYAACLMTGYDIAWFTYLFSIAFVIAWLVLAGNERRKRVFGCVRRQALPILALLVLAGLVNLPFLTLYWPMAMASGMRTYEEATRFSPVLLDITNVGEGNYIWSGLNLAAYEYFMSRYPEEKGTMANGIPPLTLVLFLAATIALWRRKGPTNDLLLVKRALSATVLITCILTLKIGDFTLYMPIYHWLPGAKGVTVLVHYQLLLGIPVVALGMDFLSSLTLPARWKWAPALLALLSLAEQFNHYHILQLRRTEQVARLATVPATIPADCKAFYIARNEKDPWAPVDGLYRHSVDAMLLAEVLRLPTVNGIDSYVPPGYDLFHPEEPAYADKVAKYAKAHSIQGLCGLDMREHRWLPPLSEQ